MNYLKASFGLLEGVRAAHLKSKFVSRTSSISGLPKWEPQ